MPDGCISVVIPVYNTAAYIAQAIESVLAQTYPADEIIVIDDGSTDDSGEIVQRYDTVRYIHQANAGQAEARNHGVRLATGDLLAFLDADDIWHTEKLAWQMQAMRADPSLDMVFGKAEQFIEPGSEADGHLTISDSMRVIDSHLPCAMLMKRASFDRVGFFSSDFAVAEVVDWYARATEAGLREQMLDRVVYRRRIHGQNIGSNKPNPRADYLAMVSAALKRRRQTEKGE